MEGHPQRAPLRYSLSVAADRERELLEQKAQALDRILNRYLELQHSAFYSRNWVELAELMEEEIARFAQAEAGED